MTEKFKYIAIFLFVCFKCISCLQKCNSHTINTSLHLGTKTPYRIIQNNSRSPYSVPTGMYVLNPTPKLASFIFLVFYVHTCVQTFHNIMNQLLYAVEK